MMNNLGIQIIQKPYFVVGAIALSLIGLAQAFAVNQTLTQFVSPLGWQIASGVVLLTLTLFQWGLLYHRLKKNAVGVRRYYFLHKYLGFAIILIFALHAARTGYGWTSILFTVFVALAVTGLLNRGIMRYRAAWLHRVWLWLHIALSALLVPLVAIHIVVALAYT